MLKSLCIREHSFSSFLSFICFTYLSHLEDLVEHFPEVQETFDGRNNVLAFKKVWKVCLEMLSRNMNSLKMLKF